MNCDNHEIYAGSPSYLITAGGSPATYAVDPYVLGFVVGDQAQQLGVAVTTSFMPTGTSAGYPNPKLCIPRSLQNWATDLIQFSRFSDKPGEAVNYGVAPDFACGHKMYSPHWCKYPPNGPVDYHHSQNGGDFRFVNNGSNCEGPGFYLAIYEDGSSFAMEAFDTWLHPGVLTFEEFRAKVLERNGNLNLITNVEAEYTTQNGNHLRFLIWDDGERFGAQNIEHRVWHLRPYGQRGRCRHCHRSISPWHGHEQRGRESLRSPTTSLARKLHSI